MFVPKNIDELEGVYELRTFVWTTRFLCVAFLLCISGQSERHQQGCAEERKRSVLDKRCDLQKQIHLCSGVFGGVTQRRVKCCWYASIQMLLRQ